jgi:formylglycine-generating enzyme required for sulfatase activity
MRWLPCAGLTLPSEAQWEYGARAGTGTAYWCGGDVASLQGVANVSDAYARRHGGRDHQKPEEGIDDGSTMHAPVGSYRANPFGLHDVHGNVYEWCRDGYDSGYYAGSHGPDPLAPASGDDPRVYRGGSYRARAWPARSSVRSYYPPGMSGHALGVRPARAIGG